VTALALTGSLIGCATLAGVNDGKERPPAPVDDSGARDEEETSVAPSNDDASLVADASVLPCAPGGDAAESSSVIHASKVKTAVTVIGEGAEWTCVDRLAFTAGQRVVGLGEGRGVADVAMQWDEQHLYLWAKVRTGGDPGTAPRLSNFNNDSFHLYAFSKAPTATYTADDHHIVIDVLGQTADYAIGSREALTGIDAKAGPRQDENGMSSFVVEAKIDAVILGRTSLAQGDTVNVNFQINDQPDIANNYRVWFRDVGVCKSFTGCDVGGGSEPFCDPRCTGSVVLR
jgi:hypothetical protein